MITWGGEEMHERGCPSPHLWVTVSKQRGLATPDHPCRPTRQQQGFLAISALALVFANNFRREGVRGYTCVRRHPVPIYAPVCWAGAGEVYAFLPHLAIWGPGNRQVRAMATEGFVHCWQQGPHARLGHEDASPLRMRLLSAVIRACSGRNLSASLATVGAA